MLSISDAALERTISAWQKGRTSANNFSSPGKQLLIGGHFLLAISRKTGNPHRWCRPKVRDGSFKQASRNKSSSLRCDISEAFYTTARRAPMDSSDPVCHHRLDFAGSHESHSCRIFAEVGGYEPFLDMWKLKQQNMTQEQ